MSGPEHLSDSWERVKERRIPSSLSQLHRDSSLPSESARSGLMLVDRNANSLGRNAVRYHFESAGSSFDTRRDIEVGRNLRFAGGHAHGAMVVGFRVENMFA